MVTFIIAVIVFLILIIVLLQLRKYINIVSKEYKPSENVFGDKNSKPNALVLYSPSIHNSVDIVTSYIINKLCSKGYTVVSNYPSIEFGYKLEDFDILCFISPVYMGRVSSPLCEVMSNSNFTGKKVIICSVGKEQNVKKELEYMKGLLNKDNQISLIKTTKEEKRKIEDFVCGAIL